MPAEPKAETATAAAAPSTPLVATAVFAVALAAGFMIDAALNAALPVVVGYDPSTALGELPGTVGSLTMGLLGVGYLVHAADGRTLAAICNVRRPSVRDAKTVLGGVVVKYASVFLLLALLSAVNVSLAGGIDDASTRTALLVGAVTSLLVTAPTEELLARRLLQDALVDSFGTWPGIVAASVGFAVPHLVVTYAGSGAIAGVSVTFVGGLVYGYAYEDTDNLAVPILIHGAFNATNYLLNYAGV